MKIVLFGGSRDLDQAFADLVAAAVAAVLAAGCTLSVGDCLGADHFALAAAWEIRPLLHRLRVSAVGGVSGAGFWSHSVPLGFLLPFSRAGYFVHWWAGGRRGVPFRGRLLRRSLAALSGAVAAVFFLSSPSSAGSFKVAVAAAQRGCRVSAFCCGFEGAPDPIDFRGEWLPATSPVDLPQGVTFWRWSPGQKELF